MKKIAVHLNFQWKRPENLQRLVGWFSLIILLAYSVVLLVLLYGHLFRAIVIPREVDQSQVTAKQEKVNRVLLQSILEKDKAKTTPADMTVPRDPF